ncbi:acyltransferase [Actinomycetospora aeridis]|uniref:Acyltransferase n=1 Tax=Actinomycetospora aeridis TaxID=3129231 RepID=A0ABU8N6A4_9PSEU
MARSTRRTVLAVIVLVLGFLPAGRIKNVLLNLAGHSIARSARVHPVILWRVRSLVMGEKAYIGPGNAFRELARVEIGDESEIGQFNWFSAAASYTSERENELAAKFVMEERTGVTSRHYIDCSGGVKICRLGMLGGVRTTILSHSTESRQWVVRGKPVVIGEATLVLSSVLINPGITISEHNVIAGGAVVVRDLDEPGRLYGGVPAKVIGDVSEGEHITRETMRHVPRETARSLLRERR